MFTDIIARRIVITDHVKAFIITTADTSTTDTGGVTPDNLGVMPAHFAVFAFVRFGIVKRLLLAPGFNHRERRPIGSAAPKQILPVRTIRMNQFAILHTLFGPLFGVVSEGVIPFQRSVPVGKPDHVVGSNEIGGEGRKSLLSSHIIHIRRLYRRNFSVDERVNWAARVKLLLLVSAVSGDMVDEKKGGEDDDQGSEGR